MKNTETVTIKTSGKAIQPATYKQLQYLRSFDNVDIQFPSASQFFKHVNVWEASEAINEALNGNKVIIK